MLTCLVPALGYEQDLKDDLRSMVLKVQSVSDALSVLSGKLLDVIVCCSSFSGLQMFFYFVNSSGSSW